MRARHVSWIPRALLRRTENSRLSRTSDGGGGVHCHFLRYVTHVFLAIPEISGRPEEFANVTPGGFANGRSLGNQSPETVIVALLDVFPAKCLLLALIVTY